MDISKLFHKNQKVNPPKPQQPASHQPPPVNPSLQVIEKKPVVQSPDNLDEIMAILNKVPQSVKENHQHQLKGSVSSTELANHPGKQVYQRLCQEESKKILKSPENKEEVMAILSKGTLGASAHPPPPRDPVSISRTEQQVPQVDPCLDSPEGMPGDIMAILKKHPPTEPTQRLSPNSDAIQAILNKY